MAILKGRLVALLFSFVLLATVSNGIAEECTSSLDGQLLLVEEGTIWRVDANGVNSREALASASSAYGLDYNYGTNTLFWSDVNTRQIYALEDKSSEPRVVIPDQGNWLPFSLAVDSVSNKIYVIDSLGGIVHLFDLRNGDNHGVILRKNLTQANNIVVDPYEGYLFIVDQFQILRTDLDGQNPLVIYVEYVNLDDLPIHIEGDSKTYKKVLHVTGITLDSKDKRVYWVNSESRTIESSDYEGNDRKVHFSDKSEPTSSESIGSLTFLDGKLYWADDATQKVFKVDASNENENSIILNNVDPIFIKAVSCSSQREIRNPCENNNGQCQQLCILSRSNAENFKCACNIGYELAQDGKSCVSVQEFLLFSQNTHLKGQNLGSNEESAIDIINPSKINVGSAAILDFNAEDGLIYYSSAYPNNQPHQVRLENGQDTILHPDLLSEDVYKLAYDWTTKNLYYFTYYYADYTTLSVLNVENPTYSKIIVDNVARLVRDIVVHPNKGYIYFGQNVNNRGSISRVATDGSDLTVLIDFENSPNGLAIDYNEDRLYWSESKKLEGGKWKIAIRHSNLDGTDIQELSLPEDLQTPNSLTIHDDWIYVITGSEQRIVRLNKRSGKEAETLVRVEMYDTVNGLKVFSRAIQTTRADHPCVKGSHECEKFCFAVPNSNGSLRGVCGCPYGEKLAEDGKSCVDNAKEEPPFVPCNKSFKCNKETVAL